jgi:hypothetical protein
VQVPHSQLASVFGAHEAEVLAQDLQQGVVHGDEALAFLAVDLEPDADLVQRALRQI